MEHQVQAWARLGGTLQLAGIAVIAFGLAQLVEELRPGVGPLGRMRATWRGVRQVGGRTVSRARSRVRTWARSLRRVVHRMLGRPFQVSMSGESHSSGSAHGLLTVTGSGSGFASPSWQGLILEDRVNDLHARLGRLAGEMDRVKSALADAENELSSRIDVTERRFEEFHSGGLVNEGWGAALLALGTVVSTWPDWFAVSDWPQALLLGLVVGLFGHWTTRVERRWWQLR